MKVGNYMQKKPQTKCLGSFQDKKLQNEGYKVCASNLLRISMYGTEILVNLSVGQFSRNYNEEFYEYRTKYVF